MQTNKTLMRMGDTADSLPVDYRILPASIPFIIPGFEMQCSVGARSLAPANIDCAKWYRQFVELVTNAHGQSFLPICRMSDGEFLFALGPQPADSRAGWRNQIAAILTILRYRLKILGFKAETPNHYNSGQYTPREWIEGRTRFTEGTRFVTQNGILAAHLSYGKTPFQERYFSAFGRWLKKERIELSTRNYVPFYFVYALLTGQDKHKILRGRILVLNGTEGQKKERIIASLHKEGASTVIWHPLSPTRSLFDKVDIDKYVGKVDLVLIGAGIGKMNIFPQLLDIGVPCIDAGYVFEVWASPTSKHVRPLCRPDHELKAT